MLLCAAIQCLEPLMDIAALSSLQYSKCGKLFALMSSSEVSSWVKSDQSADGLISHVTDSNLTMCFAVVNDTDLLFDTSNMKDMHAKRLVMLKCYFPNVAQKLF